MESKKRIFKPMSDISKCSGKDCPLKERCYRYTAKSDKYMQSYIAPKYEDGECENYWESKNLKPYYL